MGGEERHRGEGERGASRGETDGKIKAGLYFFAISPASVVSRRKGKRAVEEVNLVTCRPRVCIDAAVFILLSLGIIFCCFYLCL